MDLDIKIGLTSHPIINTIKYINLLKIFHYFSIDGLNGRCYMKKILSKEEWLRRRKIKNQTMIITALVLMITNVVFAIVIVTKLITRPSNQDNRSAIIETLSNGTRIKIDYLKPNPYSRPQTGLKNVKGVVVHYTANPGTSAKANHSYFQGLAKTHTTKASSHYIIGLEGEVIQCIPLTEIAYASNDRNADTIAVECCHPDDTGKFDDKTYESLVSLVAGLCKEFNLETDAVIRHYDVSGKSCPLYYVEHEDAWLQLKADIEKELQNLLGE